MSHTFQAISPYSGAPYGEVYEATSGVALGRILDASSSTQAAWQTVDLDVRRQFCRKASASLREEADALAELAHREMGKLLSEARAEVAKCATLCDYYADELPRLSRPRKVGIEGAHAYVAHVPLGIIFGIMPWNFPYWQVTRFAVPAIAAGNVVLLKHAPNVPGCAAALERLFAAASRAVAAEPLLRNLFLDEPRAEALIADRRVAGVSLTGSTRAGRKVGAAAGAALKPAVLELGGSDPYLVLADADLDLAVEACFTARRLNSGQSCIGAKRILVVDACREAFTARLRRRVAGLRAQTQAGESTGNADFLAPLARQDLREALHRQVIDSVGAGARLLLGGEYAGPGWHYAATLLTDVRPGMPAFDEELFGPVFAIVPARDTGHAVELANATAFGLGAAVFSGDLAGAEAIARHGLTAGAAFVNDYVRSDARLPFGGVRDSGYGRELSDEGYRAFTNVKTIYVRHPPTSSIDAE